jgi:hypothetical protein
MSMDSTLQLMVLRFPAFRTLILEQFPKNARLQALCADYSEALAAYTAWESASAPEAGERASDYRRLVAELEQELLGELLDLDAAHPSAKPGGQGGGPSGRAG